MTLYTKHIYPKCMAGESQVRPPLPNTFGNVKEISVSWDIFSDNDIDRAEYWEDTNGTMTAEEVELEVYGVEGKIAWIVAHPLNLD